MTVLEKIKRNFQKSKVKAAFDKFWYWKSSFSRLKYLLFIYFIIILISSLLLYSPWTQNVASNERIGYLDAVFTTASAFSDTGLVVKNTFEHWNIFGQAIIALLILAGGIGVFALKFFIITYIFRKRTSSIGDMILLQTERGGSEERKVSRIIIASVKFLLITIVIFSIILSIYFYFVPFKTTNAIANEIIYDKDHNLLLQDPNGNWGLAIRFGIFHTISAINNAGFDIVSGNSLMPYYQDRFVQICFIILLIIGGVGYPVIYDLRSYLKHKFLRKKQKYQFTLFTKASLIIYLLVFLVGFGGSFLFERFSQDPNTLWNKGDGQYYGSWFDKTFAIFFTSLSTRSAGFATANMDDFTPSSKIIYVVMMIIGAAPASTGGGIRTTTFGVFLMSIVGMLSGRPRVRMFRRAIVKETVDMSARIIGIALIILLTATIICSTSLVNFDPKLAQYSKINETQQFGDVVNNSDIKTEIENLSQFTSVDILFEVSSAFGTTGLSSGITSSLNSVSKIAIIIVMFIGQFGISSTLLVWKRKKNKHDRFEYVDADIAIG
ncbi:TrkH family potassium uptake protein [Mycoplasma buteonis]|uniref:TrkH family potassium uptake protein n=1 Tax=Mycoplasma buteonis TaxID=171280 RepID=UPI000AEF39C9|nr:potassium transporter TrkG [Mycoplasma buteonis]